jgi:hypothetical protein
MFNYLFITNKPNIASFVESCGVSRIFIDLERIGKLERQGHLDTVISQHNVSDISKVKSVLTSAELLVRLNPLNKDSKFEVDSAIAEGADILMLPMFNTLEEVIEFGSYINKRVKFIPLIETVSASLIIDDIEQLECVDEIHIGLNDLHLELEYSFMFELISNGYVENMVKSLSKPFGIGGIARVGEGIVAGDIVMAQHVRLNSSAVILSRAFHLRCQTLSELVEKIDLKSEIRKLDTVRKNCLKFSVDEHNEQYESFIKKVNLVVRKAK